MPLLGPGETGHRYSGQVQIASQNQQRQSGIKDDALAVKLTHKESIFHFPANGPSEPSNYERTVPLSASYQDQLLMQRRSLGDPTARVKPSMLSVDPRTAIR